MKQSPATNGKGQNALADLTRTLEALENRLSRVSQPRPASAPAPRAQAPDIGVQSERRAISQGRPANRRPDLADAVSQIVMRQKLLDEAPRPSQVSRSGSSSQVALRAYGNARTEGAFAPRPTRRPARKQDRTVGDLRAELDLLREELTRNMSSDVGFQIEDMRDALIDLQAAVSQNTRPSVLHDEIARLHGRLDQMERSGIDSSVIADMRTQLDDIDDYLDRRSLAGISAPRLEGRREMRLGGGDDRAGLKAEIERLRASMSHLASEDHLRAIEQRWIDFEERFVSEVGSQDRTAELTERMMAEIGNLRDQMRDIASEQSARVSNDLLKGVDSRFAPRDEMDASFERIAERIGKLEETLSLLPETLSLDGIDRRVETLSSAIEAISSQLKTDDRGEARFAQIDQRLDEVIQSIATLSEKAAEIDPAPVQRIEERMQALAERVDEIASDGSVALLAEKIAELNGRFDSFEASEPGALFTEQFGRLNSRLDELVEQNGIRHEDMEAIEARLSSLAERIEKQIATPVEDGAAISSLESQVGRLTQILNSTSFSVSADIEYRLSEVEKRVEENAEQIFVAAKSAADEAVRQMLQQGDLQQSEHVAKLTEELDRLQKLSTDSHVRSTDFYEAVNAALNRLIQRIDAIERDFDTSLKDDAPAAEDLGDSDVVAGPSTDDRIVADAAGETDGAMNVKLAAAGVSGATGLHALIQRSFPKRQASEPAFEAEEDEAVSRTADASQKDTQDENGAIDPADLLDSDEANRPLAIGSGAPDIAALLARVRNQKAEAKTQSGENTKADFIAAARRAALAAAEEAEGFNTNEVEDRSKRGLAETISRRRKPVMLAAGAVLLTLLALPVGKIIAERVELFPEQPVVETADKQTNGTEVAAAATDPAPAATATATASEPSAAPVVAAADPRPVAAETASAAGAAMSKARDNAQIGVSNEAERQVAATAPSIQPSSSDAAAASPMSTVAFTPEAPVRQAGPTVEAAGQNFDDQVAALPEGIAPAALLDAAKAGDPKALFEIGLRLMEGRAVTANPAEAATWFQRSAELGFVPAQYSMGTLYEKGNGVERNPIASRDWYLKAAEAGNVRAMHNLAVLYATGVDGKSEPKLAADWFIKAAEHGMTDSQYNLGILFARGAGVDQNLVASYKWFSIVGASGDQDAIAKRDEIAKSLTPEQLEAAKTSVATFKVAERDPSANTVDIPEAWAASPDKPTTTASVDMSRAIRNIQAILGKLGYDAGMPDGIVGDRTTKAIVEFQKDAGLDANGRIDEALIRALLERKDS
ncbi:hypothetical protein DYI37_11185 [Fulvimarina endophytica]|uniref:Peptidoglycan binding-like domain-containing protein n=1 Tax=Fulvimarina endophytica TaxID=2293836 RepID=A0A371X2X6_9HYPH|nr:hypothetical protein DYI37_11185 [Fulvimarina endophytica]